MQEFRAKTLTPTGEKSDEISDDFKRRKVESITFRFHLPFLMNCPSPVPYPINAEQFTCNLTFEGATKTTQFGDNKNITENYTVAISTILWFEQYRLTLEEFLKEPIASRTTFPILVLNTMIEAYQLLQKDYSTFIVDFMLIGYTSGEIKITGENEPLKFSLDYKVNNQKVDDKDIPHQRLIDTAIGFLSNDPVWIARKFFNNARRHITLGEFHISVIENVTLIETLTAIAVQAELKGQGVQNEEIEKSLSIGLKKILNLHVKRIWETKGLQESNEIIGLLLSEVYSLRNQIVHTGKVGLSLENALKCNSLTAQLADGLETIIRKAGYKASA